MIKWICSSCNNSPNSENLLNCLSGFILNISVLSTVSPCTFSLKLEFGIDCLFFFCIYTNGSLFKGTLLLHGNIYLPFLSFTLRSRERYVFTTRQFNRFFSFISYISSRAKSAEKTKSYKQTSTSSSCLRNSCWQHTFHIPEVGCSERDRLQVPNLLPFFS